MHSLGVIPVFFDFTHNRSTTLVGCLLFLHFLVGILLKKSLGAAIESITIFPKIVAK